MVCNSQKVVVYALATKSILLQSRKNLFQCPRTLKHSLVTETNHVICCWNKQKIQINLNFLFCFSNKIVEKKCFETKKFNMGTHWNIHWRLQQIMFFVASAWNLFPCPRSLSVWSYIWVRAQKKNDFIIPSFYVKGSSA